jgi:quercetin dioxygenase-like cupin family protein
MASSGQFVIRLKIPAGYVVPAHWHSTDELLTVISGDFYGGMGDKVDKKKSMVVHPGGFVAMPAKMHHFAWTKKGAIVQINAIAPFDIHYLDPKTDPTKGH